ncbi:MAG: hypothetical protein ACPG77_05005 [Nannocystaceae bacterium]
MSLTLLSPLGCGGDGSNDPKFAVDAREIEGLYAIDMHTVGDGCDGGDPQSDLSYFRLTGREFVGEQTLEYESCPDLGSCQSNFLDVFSVIQGAWAQEISSSSFDGTACNLRYTWGTLEIEDQVVTIELNHYAESDASLSESACTPEIAMERGTTMACDGYELLVGTEEE